MFRRFQSFVTIITAPARANSHYVSIGSGVECHFWAVTKTRLHCSSWVRPDGIAKDKSTSV